MFIKLKASHKEALNRLKINYGKYGLVEITADNLKLKDRKSGRILNVRY